MATNDIGRVTPIWRGFFSAATTYELNDIVIDTAGSVWWHKSEEQTTGVIPEAGEIWDAVIDMSVFSALIQAAITTAQTAVQAAQAAETGVAEDVRRAETAAQSAEASAEAASESAAGVGALAQAAEQAKNAAQTAASQAAASASSAGTSATSAGSSAQTAEAAKTAAQTAATQAAGSAETASGAAAVVEQKKAEALAAIETKGEEVLESIPEDYTELSGDVGDLKTQINTYTDYTGSLENGAYTATISAGKYTFTKDATENRKCISFTLNKGEQVIYTGRTYSSSQRSLYLVSEDGTLLARLDHNVNYNNEIVTAPSDGIVYANFATDAPITPYIAKRVVVYNSLTDYQRDDVQEIIDSQPEDSDLTALKNGYYRGSDFGTWANGYYNNYLVVKDTNSWADAYARIPAFNTTKEILFFADYGYFLKGGYKLNGNTVYKTRVNSMNIPAGANDVSICVSHIPYSTTKPITFTEAENALKIIDDVKTSEYNKYKNSFFGFEMYNKVAFVGDSYTMKRSTYNKAWGQIIGQKLGIETNLYGHSGYTTGRFRTETGSTDSLSGMLAAQANELYWLGFGINDASAVKSDDTYLGSIADISGDYQNYPNTFYGNYGNIIESIINTFPSAKIVLCNCIYNSVYNAEVGSDTTNIPAINDALIEIAQHYNIPLISLFDDIFYLSPEYNENMQADAYTHPDPILFPGMANANMRLFSKAIANNPNYFKTTDT